MTIFMGRVSDEVLRYAYALSTRDLGALLVSGGIVALIVAFGLMARRLAAFLAPTLGDRGTGIARELTKRHEEILRGGLSDRAARRPSLPGAVTVLVAGTPETEPACEVASVDEELRAGRAAGRGLRELAVEIAQRTGVAHREVYRRGLALERR